MLFCGIKIAVHGIAVSRCSAVWQRVAIWALKNRRERSERDFWGEELPSANASDALSGSARNRPRAATRAKRSWNGRR